MENKQKAQLIVKKMYDNDAFSQWLGIKVERVALGYCELEMEVKQEMTNGFGIAHGGISYALADTALAFASNSHGQMAMSIETSISHLAKIKQGNRLRAIAREDNLNNKLGHYTIEVTNQDKTLVALFKGVVYRTQKLWDI